MKYLLFLIGILCYPFILQAQWYPIFVPTTQNLSSITFTDSLHGFIAVLDGTMLESSDGGVSWQTLLTGSSTPLADINFPAFSIGYADGNGGVIIKTSNAGNTWSVINSPTTNVLRGISFLNPDTGFICGQSEGIYRTEDGGKTWVQQNSGAWWLRKFSFPTLQTGYCAGDNHIIFKTTDGGLTWNELPGSGGINLNYIQFVTVDTGYICGLSGYIAKSVDGGQTWQVLNSGILTDTQALWFFDTQTGYCVGNSGVILKTTDSGITWTPESSGTTAILERLYFLTQHQGFICGFTGTLLENCLSSPGPVTGPSTVCQGDTGMIYSVNPVTGATGYQWNVPPGVIITSGSNTNIITVTFTAISVSGSFSVNAFNSSCNGTISPSFPVIVNPDPIPTISGTVQACPGVAYNYMTQPGMSNYTWNISSGGIITGGGTSTDNTVTVNWNTVGSQTVSVNYRDVNGCLGASPAIANVNVNPNLPVSISISPSDNPVCSGTTVTYTASPINGGLNPAFQWFVNGINAGPNSPTFTYTPADNDVVICVLTSSITGCIVNNPATSNTITMTVNPDLPVSITISPSGNPVCSGTTVTYTANQINGGATPSYQWNVNSVNVGTNNPVYSYIPNNGDIVTCILTSDATCPTGNPATSNAITMTVNPNLPVSISITASSNPFCQGSSVTFTATPTNGGATPVYQWQVNSVNAGSGASTYTYNSAGGDIVTCILTSSQSCTTGNPATSNSITMVVNSNLPAGVTIAASSNPFCPGSSVTFTATSVNGGMTPAYQWKVNGVNAGANSPTFTYNPANNDSVRSMMTSDLSCVTGNPASSTDITMSGTLAPFVTFTPCNDTITTLIAQPIKLKGGIPLGGTYSGPGVNPLTGMFTPSVAGTGTKNITYTYTNSMMCSASKTLHIIVDAAPVFTCGNNLTDIRDNKVYPTVHIGSQCWMATNLNFGTVLVSTQDQRDNCIWEKYCYSDNPVNCITLGGLYQWDEIMQYDETPADQGFCPPGWHIPTENDWNTLFAVYTNNGFAGSPLKFSGFSGFNALLAGTNYYNTSWDFKGFATFFWSSTLHSPTKAWAHGMNDPDPSVSVYPATRVSAFSVRCLED